MLASMNNGFSEDVDALPQYPALIYTPRRMRKRFAANIVQRMNSEQEVLAGADAANKLQPAVVAGPVKSSEGFMVYYLVRWLD